jgi:hypothetical protein
MDIDMLYGFTLVSGVGLYARYTTTIEFKPLRHLLILTLCIFVFSARRSLLDQNIPWQDVISRATGVVLTSIFGFLVLDTLL